MLPAGDVLGRDRDRALPDALAARVRGATCAGFARHRLARPRGRSRSCSRPTAVVSAVLAEPIIRILFQRGAWRPPQTPVVAAALAAFSAGLVFNGAMLMLNRGVLQPPVELDPDHGRAGQPRAERWSSTSPSTASAPGGSRSRTAVCNIVATVALLVLLRRRLGRLGGAGDRVQPARRSPSPRRSSPSVAYAVWRPLDVCLGRSFPAQVVSLGAALAASHRRSTWRPVARSGCARCRRYSPCAAVSRRS